MGLPYLYGAALATIIAVLVVMAASVTLVPGADGDGRHADRPPAHPGHEPAGGRSRRARRRRAGAARCSAGRWSPRSRASLVLLVLASPFAGLRLGFPDRGNDAADTTTRQAYDLVSQGFGPGRERAAAARGRHARTRASATRWRALADRLREEPGVAAVAEPVASADGGAVDAHRDRRARRRRTRRPRTSIAPPARRRAPRRGRRTSSVGGATAAFMDQSQATADRLPLFIGGVVGPLVPAAAGQLPLDRRRR